MGGAEFCLARIMKAADMAGAQVFCWTPAEARIRTLFANEEANIVQFLNWPPVAGEAKPVGQSSWRPIKRLIRFWSEARALRREFARRQPDLVFINVAGAEAAALGARLAGANRITLYHGPARLVGGFLRMLIDLILKIVTAWSVPLTIHVSESNRRGWCRLCRYPTLRTQVILNGVPGPRPAIDVHAKRLELGIPNEAFIFCFPARFSWMKGHSYLLEAIGAGPNDFSGSQVLLCGEGEDEAALRAQCERLSLTAIVQFLGWRTDIREIIQASDCVVLPSLYESFSLAALEAAMEGRPLIATKVGGFPEIVWEEQTGILVPPKSPAELRQAMLRVMANREWAAELGRHARQRALTQFTVERMLSEYVRVIEEQSR